MTRRERGIVASAAGLMVLGAVVLGCWGSWQRLGTPGVRVHAEPFPFMEPTPGGSNRVTHMASNSVALPVQVLDFASVVTPMSKSVYDTLPADTTYGQRTYVARDGFGLLGLAVLMGKDRTSIHQPQYCLVGSGWTITRSEKVRIPITQPVAYELPVMRLTTRGTFTGSHGGPEDRAGVFVYWFVADGQVTNDHSERMWWMARDLLTRGVLQRWAYVVCFAPCLPGQEDATFERLRVFIAAAAPQIQPGIAGAVPVAPKS